MRRFEVWGDPIAHSLSPALHDAAYAALGVDWSYGRRRVGSHDFAAALAGADPTCRGLSLTMPLKAVAHAASVTRDGRARLTGSVNTLLLGPDGPHGFNTDVGGIVRDLREHDVADVGAARIVGAGATATSALVALGELGATDVDIAARRPERAAPLLRLGEQVGIHVTVHDVGGPSPWVPLTVAALPGGAAVDDDTADGLASAGGMLYDVVYAPWPTDLARAWRRAGRPVVAGGGMLLHQALLQVRVFHHGEADTPLPGEAAVLTAMRAALPST